MTKLILTLTFLFSLKVSALSLLQETSKILCENGEKSVVIEANDSALKINGKKYRLGEFLDSAILAERKGSHAHIQMLPKNRALLIVGQLSSFREGQCDQKRAAKVCKNKTKNIYWSPTKIGDLDNERPVRHYGVYPNDGTYFLAYDEESGYALIDFGFRFVTIDGPAFQLDCNYLD